MIRLMQNLKSINSVIVILFKKITLWYASLLNFHKTVPQFNGNLRTQFNEGKGYQGIRTVKTYELENTRSDIKKMVRSLRKK